MSLNNKIVENIKAISRDHTVYWHYYGLKHDPFVENNHVEFYIPFHWEQYFDLLHYLCHSSNVLLTVTAQKKMGKTIFLREFLQYFTKETVQIFSLVGNHELTSKNFIATLVQEFNFPPSPHENIEDQLDEYLILLQQGEGICLLVIDDAHLLPKQTLQTLLYLIKHQSQDQMRLHILLIGEPLLSENLASLLQSDNEKNSVYSISLEPFDLKETKKYIENRLFLAGLPAALPFPLSAITQIFHASKGMPEKINQIARQILIANMRKSRWSSFINFDFVRLRLSQFLGGFILCGILIFFSMIFLRNVHSSSPLTKTESVQHLLSKKSLPDVIPSQEPVNKTETVVLHPDISPAPQVSIKSAANSAVTPIDKPAVNSSAFAEKIPAQVIQINKQPKNIVSPQNKLNTENVQLNVQTSSHNFSQAFLQTPLLLQRKKNTSSLGIPEIIKPIAKSSQSSQKEVEKNEVASTKKKTNPASGEMSKKQYVEKIKSNSVYVLQLIGLSCQEEVAKFLNENHLDGKVTVLSDKPHGKNWYVVLYGQYQTSAQAYAALENLPVSIKNLKPWIRKI